MSQLIEQAIVPYPIKRFTQNKITTGSNVLGFGQPMKNPCESENSAIRLPKSPLTNKKNRIYLLYTRLKLFSREPSTVHSGEILADSYKALSDLISYELG